jgi:photosystem II stability/assembly factor-like uncharacterized protein
VSNARNNHFAHLVIFSVLISLFLLLSSGIIPSGQRVSASAEAVKWSEVNIPAEGGAGNWALAAGSDIQHLTMSTDGTLYAYGKGLPYTLFKSTDGGLKWSYTGQVQDTITDIAVSPHDSNIIYYATSSQVYRSTNGGKNFLQMPVSPGGAGSGHIEITSLAVTWLDNNILAVGTRDTDNAEFGGVFTLEENVDFSGWIDTGIGAYDIYAVIFSPAYASDRDIVAVATDEIDTFVMSRIGNSGWNTFTGQAILDKDNSGSVTPVATAHSAVIAFTNNYNALTSVPDRIFFVGIDTGAGEGDVYKIRLTDMPGISQATDLNIGSIYGQTNIDITSLAIGNINGIPVLAAGTANSSQTYTSTDGGLSWMKSDKEPTGSSDTEVILSPDSAATGVMYAATSGSGSAFSVSRDAGMSWNQTSFIDTTITNIVDVAPSPEYSRDNTLFMITFGGASSLWRSQDDANSWERVFSSANAGVDSLSLVILPPEYGTASQKVLLSGSSSGQTAIWESGNNGQSYRCQITNNPATSLPFPVNTWAMADTSNFYIGSYDGIEGQIYQTSNGGFFYPQITPVGTSYPYSMALSPDFQIDGNILVGTGNGWIYLSTDNDTSYQPLPLYATLPPLTGKISVAFDPSFSTNHFVYAASDTANGGIYRFTVGQSTAWVSIDASLPSGGKIVRLSISDDGILYAINSNISGGMERCLNPRTASGASFETVADGLTAGAVLSGLWQCDHRLWTMDVIHGKLMTYIDTLTVPAIQVSPGNNASSVGNMIDHSVRNVTLDWETITGATSYEWQCSVGTDFSSIPAGFTGTASSSSVRLPALDAATTYYWRVRASAPVFSPWSPEWSFTTSMDMIPVTLKPESPAAGARDIPVKPVFQWTAVVGADAYELLVATDADFNHPVILKIDGYSLPANAWQCDVSLDFETTYYWKVRAATSGTNTTWSSVGVFTTLPAPVENNEPTPTTDILPTDATPLKFQDSMAALSVAQSPEQASPVISSTLPPSVPISGSLSSIPNWVIYFIGGLLAIIILVLVVLLAVVLKIKRIA